MNKLRGVLVDMDMVVLNHYPLKFWIAYASVEFQVGVEFDKREPK